ncbi:MAG: 16S rRNA (cytosine(967)-C(5))-methyltransferase RsmB [Gammaproteobacteria bacterium]
MHNMNTRTIAAKIISDTLTDQISLTISLASDQYKKLVTPFVQEMVYGTFRWLPRLNSICKQFIHKPFQTKDTDIYALILLGFYQLLFMRVPEHAALFETANAARELKKPWAVKVINGVLRNFQRKQQQITFTDLEGEYAHPIWFIHHLQKAWPEHWKAILHANNEYPPFSLRVNESKIQTNDYKALLNENNIKASMIPEVKTAIILEKAMNVAELPGFSDGLVSVQDAAAQIAAVLLKLEPNQKVLDACAAPGGKTSHILESQNNLSELIALDIAQERCDKINENLNRLNLISSKVKVIAGDALNPKTWWDKNLFDRILLDAPCSATGIIRRHPDIKSLRQKSDIKDLVQTQYDLISTLWDLLKPKGILVYATCSILPEENMQVIEKFLKNLNNATEEKIIANWGHECAYGRQILPGENNMDGFYYARLVKAS